MHVAVRRQINSVFEISLLNLVTFLLIIAQFTREGMTFYSSVVEGMAPQLYNHNFI